MQHSSGIRHIALRDHGGASTRTEQSAPVSKQYYWDKKWEWCCTQTTASAGLVFTEPLLRVSQGTRLLSICALDQSGMNGEASGSKFNNRGDSSVFRIHFGTATRETFHVSQTQTCTMALVNAG